MKLKYSSNFIFVMFLVLILSTNVFARTRLESVENFLDSARISNEGYSEVGSTLSSISATSQALWISSVLGVQIDNIDDLLLFYQSCHNSNGGFGNTAGANSTWEATVSAVYGLPYVKVNSSQLTSWGLSEYINSTAVSRLYLNQTSGELRSLNPEVMKDWIDYLTLSTYLGFDPTLTPEVLIQDVLNLQFSNGSYASFPLAVYSLKLLIIFREMPIEVDLAVRYVNAFVRDDGAFSFTHDGHSTLEASILALSALSGFTDIKNMENSADLVKFVLDSQVSNSGFHEYGSSEATMESSWLAIQILDKLGKVSELFTPDILQEYGFIPIQVFPILFGFIFVLNYRRFK